MKLKPLANLKIQRRLLVEAVEYHDNFLNDAFKRINEIDLILEKITANSCIPDILLLSLYKLINN
jgi:hypothetical protein